MEDIDIEELNYSFLEKEEVEKVFGELNISLLSGRHIDMSSYSIFEVLQRYEAHWKNFYEKLYRLNLKSEVFDGHAYYYLDFFDTGKGSLSDQRRNKELTPLHTVIGLMLLDMYYSKYFDDQKIVSWEELKIQITESDHQEAYKRILFGEVRISYDEKEWARIENQFKSAVNRFDKLGWVSKQYNGQEELLFEIMPCIHRVARMYEKELADFSEFSKKFQTKEEES